MITLVISQLFWIPFLFRAISYEIFPRRSLKIFKSPVLKSRAVVLLFALLPQDPELYHFLVTTATAVPDLHATRQFFLVCIRSSKALFLVNSWITCVRTLSSVHSRSLPGHLSPDLPAGIRAVSLLEDQCLKM